MLYFIWLCFLLYLAVYKRRFFLALFLFVVGALFKSDPGKKWYE